ncbi:hypothetical protein D5086_030843 [Populus alba]|uniref:Uncharacterized protein n=1 Tax=Populus alba TaxID=43335 RepID=A0ACC4AQL6_POPAL
MKLLAAPCVDPFEFDAKGITIEFIVVKVSQDGSPVKSRQSFRVKRGELFLDPLKECTYRNLLWSIGIRLPSKARAQLIEAISRSASSLPCEADHIFVCVVALEPWYEIHFNVMTGIHVDEDKEISWDFVENPFNHVLQACKPPIPCLKKVKIEDNMASNDALCCPICLQDFSVGFEIFPFKIFKALDITLQLWPHLWSTLILFLETMFLPIFLLRTIRIQSTYLLLPHEILPQTELLLSKEKLKPTQQQKRYRKSPYAPADGEDGGSAPSEDATANE